MEAEGADVDASTSRPSWGSTGTAAAAEAAEVVGLEHGGCAEPPPKKQRAAARALRCGPSSYTLMPGGTPQEGWKMTSSMSAEKIGVGEVGLPTTIFSGQDRLAVLVDRGHLLGHAVPDVEARRGPGASSASAPC